MRAIAEVRRGHHPVQGQLERAGGIGQEVGDAAQRLVLARIEHMQNGADQQRVRGFFPMVALLQGAFGIDQNVRDVLHVAHFMRATPHLQQRVVGCRLRIGRVEQQAVREARAPAGGDLPVLTLDVVDDGRRGPAQQGGHYQAHALARARGREGQDVFRAFMSQVLAIVLAQEHTGRLREASPENVLRVGPARRAVGRDQARLARAPYRHGDGDAHGDHAAGTGNGAAGVEDFRRISAEEEPPLKQLPRVVDRRAKKVEPGRAKAYLIAKGRCRPLCGGPHSGDHDAEHHGDLTKQHVRPLHDLASDFSCADSSWRSRHRGVPQASGSVSSQCWSKTVLSRKVKKKERMSAVASQRKAPQAKTHCGVSNRRMKMMRRTDNDQNLGGSFGGVYGVSPSP
ncbi:Uncharacterised protein [Achromobacter xylosoxidans]|nr:Uncharacterised protein [Achromobacter xylosoxidans]